MSNTIRLTSVDGEVRWAKSLSYDGNRLAQQTGTAWIAHDLDWPDRDDYPRWFLPRGTEQPTLYFFGSVVINTDGTIQFPGPLTDDQLDAIMEAGAVVYSNVETRLYNDEGAVLHYQYADWSNA
jgi:hypothetical protein